MCGRSACTLAADAYFATISRITGGEKHLQREWKNKDKYYPSYNVSPGKFLPVLYRDQNAEAPYVLQSMRWGLVPSFGPVPGATLNNARVETIDEKPIFKRLLNTRRCAVVVDGFYEWYRPAKRAYFIHAAGSAVHDYSKLANDAEEQARAKMVILAGLFDHYVDKNTGEELFTFTVITTDSAPKFASAIHDRQPLILSSMTDVEIWLDTKKFPFHSAEVQRLLTPSTSLEWYPVSSAVNSSRNNSAECVKRLDGKSGIAKFFTVSPKKQSTVKSEPADEKPAPKEGKKRGFSEISNEE